MTFRRRSIPRLPSKRAVATQMAFMSGQLGEMPAYKAPVKRGKQAEGLVNKAIAKWAALRPDLTLGRNKRRLATPPGMSQPIMLGWLVDGSSDWIGYRSIVITPSMVGQRIAQFVALEAKTDTGTTSKQQDDFIAAVRAAGGVAGVVRSALDAADLLK